MTEQPPAHEPDSPDPAQSDADAGKTVVREVQPAGEATEPTDAAAAQPTVARGTMPEPPPPDPTPADQPAAASAPVGEPLAAGEPPAPVETYRKPSAPAATEWGQPAEAELDGAPSADGAAAQSSSPFEERPELAVGAAFAGGLLVALILKRLAR